MLMPDRHAAFIIRPALVALLIALALGGTALSGHLVAAQGSPTVQTRNVGALGTVLTGANGLTLYTFDRDMPGVSTCNDQCATLWPPLVLDAGAPVAPAGLGGTLGVITRADSRRQVVYNNQPLYFYMPDTQPGDTRGEGIGGVWHVATPVLAAAPAAAPPTAAAPQAAGGLPRTGTGLVADRAAPGGWALGALALGALALGGLALRARQRA